jgi:hypothetical protein
MTFLIFLASVAVLDQVLFRPERAKKTVRAEDRPNSKAVRSGE